jgi:hypothetical protein
MPNKKARLLELKGEIAREQALSLGLMSKIVDIAGSHVPGISAKKGEIHQWIVAGAWTEATFALIEIAVPQWRLRRLAYEDGVWRCSLAKQWNVPDWLSDNAEGCHPSPTLAILSAVIEASLCTETLPRRPAGSVPKCPLESDASVGLVCCDNFA